jgi:hypothetical protein
MNRLSILLTSSLVTGTLAVAGCSSSSAPASGSTTGATASTTSTTGTTTGTGAGGATTTTTTGGGGAGTGGGGTGGAGTGGGSAAPILPLATGNTWVYEVTDVGSGDACGSGDKTTTIVGPVEHAGKQGFSQKNLCNPGGTVDLAAEGDRLFAWTGAEWRVALDAPIEEGKSWTMGEFTRTWHDAGQVTVPAGTFDDCWRVDQMGPAPGSFTYCRGVGLVAETTDDGQGNGSDVKLASKSF